VKTNSNTFKDFLGSKVNSRTRRNQFIRSEFEKSTL
jgi:hypothetical protein